jgi:hypothetical protein
MGDDELTFKVTDRRHRPEQENAPSGGPTPPSEPQPAHRTPPSDPGLEPEATGDFALARIFAIFATSALMSLGEAEDPIQGESRIDLGQAREAIDALMVLRQKTEGNRTPEESRLLEGLLYDLQMRYVRAAKGGRSA